MEGEGDGRVCSWRIVQRWTCQRFICSEEATLPHAPPQNIAMMNIIVSKRKVESTLLTLN